MNALKILSTIIGAITPLMYFHGRAFHSGWIDYWNLPQGLFPPSLEETLINGYVAYTVLAIPYLAAIFTYLLLAVGTLYNIRELSKFEWIKKITRRFSTKKKEEKGHPLVENALANAFMATVLSLFVLLFLFLAIKIYEKADTLGKESAQRYHQRLITETNIQSIQTGENRILGHVITCSSQFCGLIADNTVMIVPIANDFEATWAIADKKNTP